MGCIGNVFWLRENIQCIKQLMENSQCLWDISTMMFIFLQVWKYRIWIWKPQGDREKMNSSDRNIYAWNILDRYENRFDNLDDLCLPNFASTDVSKIAVDGTVECEVLENDTLPVSDFCETPVCKKVIKLKNGLGEMRKGSRRQCVIEFYKVLKQKVLNIGSTYETYGTYEVSTKKLKMQGGYNDFFWFWTFLRNFLNFIFENILSSNLTGCVKLISTCPLVHIEKFWGVRQSTCCKIINKKTINVKIKMNITVVFVPLLVLNNVRFHNYKNFPGFYKLLFIRKIDTGYFNCSSVTLKQ